MGLSGGRKSSQCNEPEMGMGLEHSGSTRKLTWLERVSEWETCRMAAGADRLGALDCVKAVTCPPSGTRSHRRVLAQHQHDLTYIFKSSFPPR